MKTKLQIQGLATLSASVAVDYINICSVQTKLYYYESLCFDAHSE